MRFELRGISADGHMESLDLQALDEASAREQAEGRGYTVLAVRSKARLLGFSRPGDRFPLLLFSQELLVLIDAGLPLTEAIDTLAEKEKRGDFRTVLARIVLTLREGRTLSSALEEFPTAFPALFVASVRASEKTSDLPQALARYVAYQNQIDALRKRIVNAGIYPMLLLGVGGIVGLFLMFYVVPRFGRIYEDRGTDLPFVSRVLLSWGKLVEGHGFVVLGVLGGLIIALIYASRTARFKAAVGDAMWRLPTIGERMKVYQLARFYRTIGMLLKGGMPLVAALDMGAQLLHAVLRTRLAAASLAIREGRSVSESLEMNGLTTPVAMRMLAVGEHSGNMGEMMERIATFHDEEMSRWVEWFTRMFEPLLMAFIGLIIGGIVILMYMPVFELAGSLK